MHGRGTWAFYLCNEVTESCLKCADLDSINTERFIALVIVRIVGVALGGLRSWGRFGLPGQAFHIKGKPKFSVGRPLCAQSFALLVTFFGM